jgi:hypothetical protein
VSGQVDGDWCVRGDPRIVVRLVGGGAVAIFGGMFSDFVVHGAFVGVVGNVHVVKEG